MFVNIVGLSTRISNMIPALKEYIKSHPDRIRWRVNDKKNQKLQLNLEAKTEEFHALIYHPIQYSSDEDDSGLYQKLGLDFIISQMIISNYSSKKIVFLFDGDADLKDQFNIIEKMEVLPPVGWYYLLLMKKEDVRIKHLQTQIDAYLATRKNCVSQHYKEFIVENNGVLINTPEYHAQNMEQWMRFIDSLPYIEKKKAPRKKNAPILLLKDITIDDIKKKKFWKIVDFNFENPVESEIVERKKVLNNDEILHGGVLVLKDNRVYPILISKYYEDGGEVGEEFIYFDNQWKFYDEKIILNGELEGQYLSFISTIDIHEYQEGFFDNRKENYEKFDHYIKQFIR